MSAFNRILLCYDATREGRKALRQAAALVEQMRPETHLLAILNSTAWLQGTDITAAVPPDVVEQSAREILQDGIARLAARGVIATGHFAIGHPLEQIPEFVKELNIDLVVVGHRHSGMLRRWWAGRNDERLMDKVSCSVLVTVGDDGPEGDVPPGG